jgi:hypothetical protein
MTDEVMPQSGVDDGNDDSPPVDEPAMPPATLPRRPWWKQAWAGLLEQRDPVALAEQRHALDSAIAANPDVPVNYLLRGEFLLTNGDPGAAEADFRRALDLAAQQLENADWGFIAQAVEDRARVGLKKAQERRHG